MPVPVIIFLVAAVIAHIVLRYTVFAGRRSAMRWAIRNSGCRGSTSNGIIIVIMGFFAGLGALAARLNSATMAGAGYELTVIASVVIGGAEPVRWCRHDTRHGRGLRTLIGVLLNGLVLMNVSSYVQQIIIGVIVLAVAFDTFAKSRRKRG